MVKIVKKVGIKKSTKPVKLDKKEELRLKKLDAEIKDYMSEEKRKIKLREQKLKVEGFKWKTIIVLHGRGDDKMIDVYTQTKPTSEKEVRSLVRGGKSATLVQFKSFKL